MVRKQVKHGVKYLEITLDILKQINEQTNEYFINSDGMEIENYNDRYDEEGNEIKVTEDWKNLVIDISKITPKKFSELKDGDIPFGNVNPFTLMKNGEEGYFSSYSELSYFEYRYQQINNFHPHAYRFEQFNVNIFLSNLFKFCEVPETAYIKTTYQSNEEPRVTNMLICFKQDLLLYVDAVDKGVIYYNPKDEKAIDSTLYIILSLLKTVKKPKVTKNKIYIVYKNQHGFDKMGFDIKKIDVDLKENYNDGFDEVANKIIEGLNNKNKTNLVILSGETGTGKTSFIRYLTSKLKKNIIFISTDMVNEITDPAFIPFLMKNNDSILIIEDGEAALEKSSSGTRNSAVSNVLNLTDGLLSDCLKISIIATFNTGIKNLDEALTRKGRLLIYYIFEKLALEKSKALLKKLGHEEIEVKEPMTLADIYFYGSENTVKPKTKSKKIGFVQ